MTPKNRLIVSSACLALAVCVLPATAHAHTAPDTSENQNSGSAPADDQAPAEPNSQDADYHRQPDDTIVVTGSFQRNRIDVLSGTSVLAGTDLQRSLRTTIGETLASQPGVSATSFGPNASRPVLRGFQGERVRVLTDGIGSFDVSNTSVDHAVAINPLTAERIEVLRGPSALLFGSSAIGGVVNVIDSRIPVRIPDEPFHAEATATHGSAANQRSGSAAIDVPLSDQIVIHLDGTYAKTDDLRTGGFILTPALRAEAAMSDDPDIASLADLRGRLPNSAGRNYEFAGGVALINEGGNLGISVNHIDNLYGVPVRYSLDPDADAEAEAVRLDMRQTRADVRAGLNVDGGFVDKIKFRAGYADYRHDELEETGEIGTSFFNQAFESRFEIVQANRSGWRGASGVQYLSRDFNVIGEEKFIPQNDTSQLGIFTLQSFDFGAFKTEAGARYEHTNVKARADADLGNPDLERRFDAYSGSIGASYALAKGIRFGLSGSHSERAPSAEELFPNGPHAGTQAFEVGNPDFVKERSWGLEATFRMEKENFSLAASAFHSWFDNYIYDQRTGEVADDLPVFEFRQADARYYGFELEASANLATFGDYNVKADGVADYVRATIDAVGPAPRIPPLRLLGGISTESPGLDGRVEVEYSDGQNRTATFETTTDSFTLVNASLTVRPFGADNRTSIVLSANNIFDVVARRHASFLKDYAPLAGRDLRVSLNASF